MSIQSVGMLEPSKSVMSYKWKVNNYSDYKFVGQCLSSPVFSIVYASSSVEWRLNLYPKGSDWSYKDYLSLFVEYLGEVDVIAHVTISILDVEQNIALLERTMEQTRFQKGLTPCGDHKFISRLFVSNSANRLLKNDTITISCKIVLPGAISLVPQVKAPSAKESDRFERLLETGKLSDVTLAVGGKKFRLHKVILASCSPVFRAMFEHDMKENQSSVVDIADVEPEVMREMVRFMYTNKVNGMDTLAVELLVAADMYAIVELKDFCEKTLCGCLGIDTALERLTLAITYNANALKAAAIEFIVRHLQDFIEQSRFKMLDSDIFIEILAVIAKKKTIV